MGEAGERRAWSVQAYLAAVGAAMAVPLLALVAYNIHEQRRESLAAAERDVLQLARASAVGAENFLDHARWILDRLAERPDAASADPRLCRPVLRQVLDLHPEFANVLTVDADGQPRCLALHEGGPRSWPVDPTVYLDEARRTLRFTIGRPVRGFVTGRWVVMLVRPLVDETGGFTGAVALPVDLARFQPVPSPGDTPPGVTLRILDGSGTIGASTLDAERSVGKVFPDVASIGLAAGATTRIAAKRDLDGVERLYGASRIGGTQWQAVASYPTHEVLAPLRRVTALSLAAVLLTLLAAAGFATVAARRIAYPVRALAESARDVEAGHLDKRATVAGPAEVARVAQSFNAMMNRLQGTQRELRDREARLRNLFEQAADGIFVIAPDHRYLDANAEGLRMFGYSHGELLALTVADLLVERERGRLDAEVARMMAGTPHLGQWEHRRKDGSTFFAEVSARAVSGSEYLAIVRDLTPRMRAEAAQREASERLRLAARAGEVGLWDWDLRTQQVFYSREWKAMIGYAEDEIADDFSEWESRVHPDDLPRCLAAARAYLESPYPDYSLEFRMRHKDGSWRWIMARAALLAGDDGKPARMLGSHVDITERRRAEDALRDLYRHLMETEERERRDIGRELHDRIGQDLAAAKLNVSLARSMMPAAAAGPGGERLDQVQKLVQSAIDHSRDIMAELRPPGLDAHGLAVALEQLAESAAARLAMTVDVDASAFAEPLPGLTETALYRIAQEALNNVAKHAGDARVRIEVSSARGRARLVVSDDGRGFDAGARAVTGHGLVTMRERAQALGAAFTVDSGPGRGTRIVVELAAGT